MQIFKRQTDMTRQQKNELLKEKLLARGAEYEGGGLDPAALARLDEDYDSNIEFQK